MERNLLPLRSNRSWPSGWVEVDTRPRQLRNGGQTAISRIANLSTIAQTVGRHGVLDSGSPADSWIALDGTNKLVAREIPTLDLRGISLVTLSACETALAEERPGAELMSLATFISDAGTASIVVSLWAVDDLATRDRMVYFYNNLAKPGPVDKARALQGAQAALASKPETRHPFFWSPFILIGDWR